MKIGWEHLNAYVDGELCPAEAAEVAAAVAVDPDLAARVATLSRLKATTTGLKPSHEVPSAPRRRAPVVGMRLAPLAASVVLIVGVALTLWLWPSGTAIQGTWLAEAVAAHRGWLDGGSSIDTGDRIRVALAARGAIPDLSDARLSLVHVSLTSENGQAQDLLVGYQGIHGCRVGLWIGEASADLEERPVAVESEGVAGYAWRSGDTGYALLARGMDPDRLRLLAEAVVRITNDRNRVDDQIRIALRQTTETGAPCAA